MSWTCNKIKINLSVVVTTSVVCAVGASVATSSTDFSFQNLVFLEFIWIFSSKNHFKINISPILNPNLNKWIPLKPAHQDLSMNTKGTFQFLRNFQLQFNLIFSEEIIQYSRTFCTTSPNVMELKPMHPSSSRAFQRHQQHNLKHPSSVDLITTKQNKTNYLLPSWIDRFPPPSKSPFKIEKHPDSSIRKEVQLIHIVHRQT